MAATKKTPPDDQSSRNAADENGSHLHMHEQHQQWNADAANWQDDLVQWQSECRNMIAEIKQFEMMVQDHQKVLTSHSENVNAHRIRLGAHEHALTEYERGAHGAELIELSQKHREESSRHEVFLTCHASLKQRHRAIVADWNHLRNLIDHAPTVPK